MAVTTITTSGADDARLVVAFGKYLGLPGNANQAQIVGELKRYMIAIVQSQELIAAQAAVSTPPAITPT